MTRRPTILLLLWSPLLLEVVIGQTLSPAPTVSPFSTTNPYLTTDCTVFNGCLDCVSAGCGWSIGTCFASCDAMTEMACYSLDWGSGNGLFGADQICQVQQAQNLDAATCGTQTSCEACTSTLLTAPSAQLRQDLNPVPTTCSWYEDRKTCSNLVCDNVGCSSPYCPSSPEGQCYFGANNCNDCLLLENLACSWSGGGCELNCLADAACYNQNLFVGMLEEQICQYAANFEADTALCRNQLDCGTCSAALKSDGSPCGWYYNNVTGIGWCGVGGCDAQGICTVPTCAGLPNGTMAGVPCAVLESLDPQDLTCRACLEASCGWTVGGQCLGSCDAIADVACFALQESETVESVCALADATSADAAICAGATDYGCPTCTTTLKSDRRSTCEWYADLYSGNGYCGIGGCDMMGTCGSVSCTANNATMGGGDCGGQFDCSSCLDKACVWDGFSCFGDCASVVITSTCYSPTSPQFQFQSTFAICEQAGGGNSTAAYPETTAPSSANRSALRNGLFWTTLLGVTLAVLR